MQTKEVIYAYPTSPMAVKYGLGKMGSYFAVLTNRPTAVPFATVPEAEAYCDDTLSAFPWNPMYITYAFRGSRFAATAPFQRRDR